MNRIRQKSTWWLWLAMTVCIAGCSSATKPARDAPVTSTSHAVQTPDHQAKKYPPVPTLASIGAPARRVGPRSVLFTDGRSATRIVFVFEGSGSLHAPADIKEQLNKAIATLRIPQSFDVVIMNHKEPSQFSKAVGSTSLLLATNDNKRAASAFLEDVALTNEPDPISALTAAFVIKPDLIYLLTNGAFENDAAVLQVAHELNGVDANGRPRTRINTILWDVAKDHPDHEPGSAVLSAIAKESGGTFLDIGESELDSW